MKIAEVYSHLNGLEYLEARKPHLWKEIQSVIAGVNANLCFTKTSQEARKLGRMLCSPTALNEAFRRGFAKCTPPWESLLVNYLVCSDPDVNRKIADVPMAEQKLAIEAAGLIPRRTSNEVDFVKEGVAVEVQFGKYSFVAHDLFVKHMTFFSMGRIKCGIEILPMKTLQEHMSSGPTFYEKDLNNLVRQGRGTPAVPLVVIGLEI
ncbi:BglII/BstYI family type II restriction endonuclease [Sphingomonas phyllosphaerae]|uniref:BglII/BstYI family type II restriction endonuclease n=1 Tax=Sphingomonas phyllosphaerae TaxID=257003 RepID=UPI0003B4F89F|nr:BglII/BstYI family type II restriction endonuclease [Sphingomonas phyllosphaerae]